MKVASHFKMLRRALAVGATLGMLTACSTNVDSGSSLAPTQDANNAADASVAGDTGADAGAVSADAGPLDAGPAEMTWKAAIFRHDPVTDKKKLTEVTLATPTDKDGHLIGKYVDVRNCLNEDGGPPIKFQGMVVGSSCVEKHVAMPSKSGDYLSIKPPEDYSDPNDSFSELMMYHQVNTMHSYYKDVHGLTQLDKPIQAIVNIQSNLKPYAAQALGRKPGWSGMPNAAFVPKENFVHFPYLPDRDEDAIVFMQDGQTDFAYDASVIHHEYTHAMVGSTRLNGQFPDLYGMNNLPGAMNEGFADYFATTMDGDPVIGKYDLGNQGAHYVRDLTEKRVCPDDLTSEIHADGRIISSAMWEIRGLLGKLKADAIILAAIQSFSKHTEMDGAAMAIIAETKKQAPAFATKVEAILKEHGVKGCQRIKPLGNWAVMTSADQVPISLPGFQQGMSTQQFPKGLPGFMQHSIEVPAGTAGVEITLIAQSQMGPGATAPKIAFAINHDEAVMFSPFGGGVTSKFFVPVPADASLQWGHSVTLSGACLPAKGGKVVLLMLNSGGSAQLIQTFVQLDKSLKGTETHVVTCEK